MRPLIVSLCTLPLLAAAGCSAEVGTSEDPGSVVVEGKGFETEIPTGWRDETLAFGALFERESARVSDIRVAIDGAFVEGDGDSPTLAFARETAPPFDGDLAARVDKGIQESTRLIPEFEPQDSPHEIDVDGETGLVFDYTGHPEFGRVRVRSISVAHEGNVYAASLTAEPGRFDEVVAAFDGAIESWRWTEAPPVSPGKAAYIRALDEICLREEAKVAVIDEAISEASKAADMPRVQALFARGLRVASAEVVMLREEPQRGLSPQDRVLFELFLEFYTEQVRVAAQKARAIRQRDAVELENLQARSSDLNQRTAEVAAKFGLESCGQV